MQVENVLSKIKFFFVTGRVGSFEVDFEDIVFGNILRSLIFFDFLKLLLDNDDLTFSLSF